MAALRPGERLPGPRTSSMADKEGKRKVGGRGRAGGKVHDGATGTPGPGIATCSAITGRGTLRAGRPGGWDGPGALLQRLASTAARRAEGGRCSERRTQIF